MLDVEGASLQVQRLIVQREVARAWMDALYAEQTRVALQRLVSQLQLQLDAIPSGIARGRQSAADGYQVRQAFEQATDRVIEQERVVERARIALATLLGADARRALGQAPDTSLLAHPRDHLVARLDEHPEIRILDRREELARTEVDLARSTKRPDWALEVGYGQRRPFFDNMLTVMVSMDLPWQAEKRQDRDIASRLASVDRERALREDARRMHVAELQGWLADFDTAQKKIERFEKIIAPLARDRRAAALAAYEGGRGELGSVLEASRSETEVEVAKIQALAERARAWIDLDFIYPKAVAK
jgi:outer membrane protein TolC